MRGSTKTSSIAEAPLTSVKRSAICAVPPNKRPATAAPVGIAGVGCQPLAGVMLPTGTDTSPIGVW